MKNREMAEYLNSIDFALVTDGAALANIYREIGDSGASLATDPYTATSLERLVMLTDAELLVRFLRTLGPRVVYKKLGSRIVESALRRLFECMYIRGERFSLQEVIEPIDCGACINCRNATHVLRQAIMLLAARRVDKLRTERYRVLDLDGTAGGVPGSLPDTEHLNNTEYARQTLQKYKRVLSECLGRITENDAFITLAVFLQVTKSQSLVARLIETDCSAENIKKRGHVYEAVAAIANKKNLDAIYGRIKGSVMALSTDCRSCYFMQAFARSFSQPRRLYRRMIFGRFERNSNVVLALLESLQRSRDYAEVDSLVRSFYRAENGLFEELLLGKDEGLDTKYVAAVVGFMAMPSRFGYGVNEDFVRLFSPGWLASKSGKALVAGFAGGNSPSQHKIDFFDRNIDLFWGCTKWRSGGKAFMKNVAEFTTGHPRKKAFEILRRFR